MKRIAIIALLLLALPAFAATVTLSNGGSCDPEGLKYDRKTKTLTVLCRGPVTPPPVTPAPPPVVTPPPPVEPPSTPPPALPPAPPSPVGCGNAFEPMAARKPIGSPDPIPGLGPTSTSLLHYGLLGVTYSTELPRGPSGFGFLSQSDHPATPTELTLEWAISKCPGDFGYYQSAEASVPGARGGAPAFPCGGINGAVGTTIRWSPTGSFHECKVSGPGPWYINVRYLNNCSAGGLGCPVSYYHNEW